MIASLTDTAVSCVCGRIITCLRVLSLLLNVVVRIRAYAILSKYHSISSAVGGAEFEEALKAAVQMNVYNKRAAAAAHLCLAWSQAIDVSVLGSGGSIFSGECTPLMTPCLPLPSHCRSMHGTEDGECCYCDTHRNLICFSYDIVFCHYIIIQKASARLESGTDGLLLTL
jgi:hypothetical protein